MDDREVLQDHLNHVVRAHQRKQLRQVPRGRLREREMFAVPWRSHTPMNAATSRRNERSGETADPSDNVTPCATIGTCSSAVRSWPSPTVAVNVMFGGNFHHVDQVQALAIASNASARNPIPTVGRASSCDNIGDLLFHPCQFHMVDCARCRRKTAPPRPARKDLRACSEACQTAPLQIARPQAFRNSSIQSRACLGHRCRKR